MENFIVSARKYRPKTFDTVIGQQSITSTLKNAIRNNQLAQAFLFCGPRGIGKTTCARILAKTINCENITENIEPCDKCESCTSFNQSISFNIHELDAASNNSVDDIRNLVDQVRIPPQVGKFKVYIIDEVHMLSQSAFNAFLKTLEEPPSYAKFILATTEKHKIIPTILSRCQIFDFKRISIDDIVKQLNFVAKNEKIYAETNALHIIAQKSDGALRDALSIFDQIVSFTGDKISYKNVIENLNVLDYDYYFKIIETILNNNIPESLLIINEIIDNGFDGQHFLIGLGEHLRNLLVCKDTSTIQLLETGEDFKTKYKEQSEKCSVNFLLKALDINNNCDINYKTSNNKRLHLEISIMQMCSITSPVSDEAQHTKKTAYTPPPLKKQQVMEKDTSSLKPVPKPEPEKHISDSTATTPQIKKSSDVTPGTISIKQAFKQQNENNKKNEFHDIKEEHQKTADEFSQDQLEKTWKTYISSISEKLPSFSNAIAKNKPVLKENFVIEFKTDNKLIANDKLNISDLSGYLKKELNNYQICLVPIVATKEENNIAYTDQEKFEKMAEKNPAVRKMKEQLNLEIEF